MSNDPEADLKRVARDLLPDIIREGLHRWAQIGVAIGDLIFIVSDGDWPGIPEGPQVVRFDLIRPLCEARIGKGLRNMEVKEFCAPQPAMVLRTAFLSKDGPGQLFYTDVAKLLPSGADRRARALLAAQVFGIALSLVCLWGVWSIGWDFVEHMPSADLGAW